MSLNTVISDIYEASYRPEYWPVVLQGIARLTGSRSAAMLYRDTELEQAGGMYSWNIPPDIAQLFGQAGDDPNFLILGANLPVGVAAAVDHIVPDRQELEKLYGDFFTNFMVPADMYHVAGVILFNDETRSVGIGLQRGKNMGPWKKEQIEPLTGLAPHIQRALHIHKEFVRLRTRESALQAGLDRMVMGMILLDHGLEVVYCNPAAESILDSHPALRLKNGRLFASRFEDRESLHHALLKAMDGRGHGETADCTTALGLEHADCSTPLPLLVSPASGLAGNIPARDLQAHVVVCLSDPEKNQPVVPEALCSAYRLTPAEAQVAIAIANGISVDDIAVMHENSVNTIRSQIRSVFRKLGINRQTELVRILLSGPFRAEYGAPEPAAAD